MGTPYKNAAGLTPEDVYDPDIVGDGPDAAINGIGYRKADGTLLRFAAAKYGTAAANHGYRLSDGRDFSALWAAKGTANYALSINGQTFSAGGSSGTTTSTATVSFACSTGGWQIVTSGTNQPTTTAATGSIPPSATAIQITDTWKNASGDTGAGNATNNYASKTTLSGSQLGVSLSISGAPSQPEHVSTHQWDIVFYNAAGAAISTTTIYAHATAAGAS